MGSGLVLKKPSPNPMFVVPSTEYAQRVLYNISWLPPMATVLSWDAVVPDSLCFFSLPSPPPLQPPLVPSHQTTNPTAHRSQQNRRSSGRCFSFVFILFYFQSPIYFYVLILFFLISFSLSVDSWVLFIHFYDILNSCIWCITQSLDQNCVDVFFFFLITWD